MSSISLKKIVEKLGLTELTEGVEIDPIRITQPDINRPALQITGYFEHFDATRLQVIGFVEYSFMDSMSQEEKEKSFRRFLSFDIPGIVFCRGLIPDPLFLAIAQEEQVPVMSTSMATSAFTSEVIRWLSVQLAPEIRIHGVLVDVYGVGLLITGESGIGKSEAALELIRRGHRLVSDDVVEIRKVSEATLVGTAPDITKHFIELRGIGIIDVKMLFGASCVRETQNIDIVIKLEDWDKERDYDRMGLDEEYTEYLGNRLVMHRIPIRPGRNLAIILESAAVNYRQKQMGYNAAQELYRRVQESLARHSEGDSEDLDNRV